MGKEHLYCIFYEKKKYWGVLITNYCQSLLETNAGAGHTKSNKPFKVNSENSRSLQKYAVICGATVACLQIIVGVKIRFMVGHRLVFCFWSSSNHSNPQFFQNWIFQEITSP